MYFWIRICDYLECDDDVLMSRSQIAHPSCAVQIYYNNNDHTRLRIDFEFIAINVTIIYIVLALDEQGVRFLVHVLNSKALLFVGVAYTNHAYGTISIAHPCAVQISYNNGDNTRLRIDFDLIGIHVQRYIVLALLGRADRTFAIVHFEFVVASDYLV